MTSSGSPRGPSQELAADRDALMCSHFFDANAQRANPAACILLKPPQSVSLTGYYGLLCLSQSFSQAQTPAQSMGSRGRLNLCATESLGPCDDRNIQRFGSAELLCNGSPGRIVSWGWDAWRHNANFSLFSLSERRHLWTDKSLPRESPSVEGARGVHATWESPS